MIVAVENLPLLCNIKRFSGVERGTRNAHTLVPGSSAKRTYNYTRYAIKTGSSVKILLYCDARTRYTEIIEIL